MRRREHTRQRQLWVGVLQKGTAFLVHFIMVTLVQSFMEINAYQPLHTNKSETLMGISTVCIKRWHIGNEFVPAVFISYAVSLQELSPLNFPCVDRLVY